MLPGHDRGESARLRVTVAMTVLEAFDEVHARNVTSVRTVR
jgi:hypothetical protein